MIFKIPPKLGGPFNIKKYLIADLWGFLKEVVSGLNKLTFAENFESFTVSGLFIKAGTEVSIPNGLQRTFGGGVPSGYIVVRSSGGNSIIDGDTAWSASNVYLKNIGSNDATITVIFFR